MYYVRIVIYVQCWPVKWSGRLASTVPTNTERVFPEGKRGSRHHEGVGEVKRRVEVYFRRLFLEMSCCEDCKSVWRIVHTKYKS